LNNDYNYVINTYSKDYFIGVGTGKGATEGVTIQIVKARAPQ